jgi:hypothetical protein
VKRFDPLFNHADRSSLKSAEMPVDTSISILQMKSHAAKGNNMEDEHLFRFSPRLAYIPLEICFDIGVKKFPV